jgi:hypothetical protein
MSAAKPMGTERRCASYGNVYHGQMFTPAQRRRLDRKARRNGGLPVATFQLTPPKNRPTPRQRKRRAAS